MGSKTFLENAQPINEGDVSSELDLTKETPAKEIQVVTAEEVGDISEVLEGMDPTL